VFAVDGGGRRALPEVLDSVRAAGGARTAVFAASDRGGVIWPGPAAPRLARICVPCQAGNDEESLAAAMLALVGPARGVGCIGIDMMDIDDTMFRGGDGFAIDAAVPPGLAKDTGRLIAERLRSLGLEPRRVQRALISAVMTKDCTLHQLDDAIGSARTVIGDREDMPVAFSAQFLPDGYLRLATTLLAFIDS